MKPPSSTPAPATSASSRPRRPSRASCSPACWTATPSDVIVHTQICPELVPLVEAGELNSPPTRDAVTAYLAPLTAAGIDELVLGCTHYPFLRPLIEEAPGPAWM